MAGRAFEEEAGLYDSALPLRNEMDRTHERPLDGLPPPRVILLETSQAVVAALAAGVFLGALLQWTGVR